MATSTSIDDNIQPQQIIETYIRACLESEKEPSLLDFLDTCINEVAAKTDLRSDIKRTWIKRYQTVVGRMDVESIVDENIDWNEIKASIREIKTEQPTSSKRTKISSSSTQTSKTGSWELSDEAKDRFKKDYEKMEEEDKKWLLRIEDDGTKVYLEDVMFKYGMECEYEHAVHSFIFDPKDDCWKDWLTKEELRDIATEGGDVFPCLDESVQNVFEKCEKALKPLEENDDTKEEEYVDCIWKAITSFGFFDPKTQPQEYWIQNSLLDYLDLYRHGTISEMIANGSEQDFVVRCWSNLDRCFQDLGVVGRNRTCHSTLIRVNSDRKVSGMKPVEEQASSVRPDFLVINDGLDFAVGECGKDDVAGVGKKEIVERQLHVPKVMKDIFCRALAKGNHEESLARTLRITALNENSTRVQAEVLDCPRGYVCRLLSSNEYHIPEKADMISAELFSLMKLTLQVKAIAKNSIKTFKKHRRDQAKKCKGSVFTTQESKTTIHIPSTFTIPNIKRPKTSDI